MDTGCLMEKITRMFFNQEHCDVTFNIQGRQLGAHKLVLIAQEFHLFAGHKDEAVINVTDIDYETFHSIIRYFYKEDIDINSKNVFKLMHAAHVLHISVLADQCASFLIQRTCTDNFVYLVNASVDFKSAQLQKHLSLFFGIAMNTIIHDISFKYLSPEGIALLITVTPVVSVCSHLQFFVMLHRWARAESERQSGRIATGLDIRNTFGEHFRKLRVPLLHSEDVARLVIGQDLMTKEEEFSLLHLLSLPAYLRTSVESADYPFDLKPMSSKNEKDYTWCVVLQRGNCALCKAELDGCYGAERIHCAECDFDICMRCLSAPQHQHHRKFCCVKTVFGKPKDCCNSCGWPVEPTLFHPGNAVSSGKNLVTSSGADFIQTIATTGYTFSAPPLGKQSHASKKAGTEIKPTTAVLLEVPGSSGKLSRTPSTSTKNSGAKAANATPHFFGGSGSSRELNRTDSHSFSKSSTSYFIKKSGAESTKTTQQYFCESGSSDRVSRSTKTTYFTKKSGNESAKTTQGYFDGLELEVFGRNSTITATEKANSAKRSVSESPKITPLFFGRQSSQESEVVSTAFDFTNQSQKKQKSEIDQRQLCKNCKRPLK